jgi:translation initiation factor 2 alpha subunit (eIF-2alpha)
MRHVAEATQTPLETLYQQISWPLNRKYGHSHDAFKLSITYVAYTPAPKMTKILGPANI